MYTLTVQLESEDGGSRATIMEKKSDSATVSNHNMIFSVKKVSSREEFSFLLFFLPIKSLVKTVHLDSACVRFFDLKTNNKIFLKFHVMYHS